MIFAGKDALLQGMNLFDGAEAVYTTLLRRIGDAVGSQSVTITLMLTDGPPCGILSRGISVSTQDRCFDSASQSSVRACGACACVLSGVGRVPATMRTWLLHHASCVGTLCPKRV